MTRHRCHEFGKPTPSIGLCWEPVSAFPVRCPSIGGFKHRRDEAPGLSGNTCRGQAAWRGAWPATQATLGREGQASARIPPVRGYRNCDCGV